MKHKTDCINRYITNAIINAYQSWFQEKVNIGWDCYIITFKFYHINASPYLRALIMLQEVEIVYRTLLTRIVRNTKRPGHERNFPRWIVAPDLPVWKHIKIHKSDVTVNDGLHVHALALIPNESRLKVSLDWYIREHQNLFLRGTGVLRDVSSVMVKSSDAGYVTGYVLKAIRNRRMDLDDILILPRARSEVVQKPTALNPSLGRRLRD